MNTPADSLSDGASNWPEHVSSRCSSASALRLNGATVFIAALVFGGYGSITWFFNELPLWIAGPVTALWLTWYGSLQHETIHNHPTPWRRINALLGSLPLALWIPYRVYRVAHLQHHRHGGRELTEVLKDPESFYLQPGTLAKHGPFCRRLHLANCTLAGRLVLGPALSVCRFWSSEILKVRAGDAARRAIWVRHFCAAGLVLVWLTQVCHVSLWIYVVCAIYPSISLTHLRSFAEHRADAESSQRTVAVEGGRLWSLLFLNNNLHIAHHAYPKLPWYELPAAWRHLRSQSLNRGLVISGYLKLFQDYLWRPLISPEHPGLSDGDGN